MKVKRFKEVFQAQGMDDRTIKVKQYAHHFSIILEQLDGTDVVLLEISRWEVGKEFGITEPDIDYCIAFVRDLCFQLGNRMTIIM